MALPPTVSLQTANRILSLGRSTGYGLARRGAYPCKVLKLGSAYRVVTADLQRLLALDDPAEELVPEPSPRVQSSTPTDGEVGRDCCCRCRC
ncbi:hypothetical protein [Streptomyces goshikiensis]|uniref:hypothetical protein n=1 Tax=Streptomyces goshikiensis TaxID=1942 RepID=UPI00331AFBD0